MTGRRITPAEWFAYGGAALIIIVTIVSIQIQKAHEEEERCLRLTPPPPCVKHEPLPPQWDCLIGFGVTGYPPDGKTDFCGHPLDTREMTCAINEEDAKELGLTYYERRYVGGRWEVTKGGDIIRVDFKDGRRGYFMLTDKCGIRGRCDVLVPDEATAQRITDLTGASTVWRVR